MSMRDDLKTSYKKQRPPSSPSKAYDRFFEDYTETRENGRVVRVYKGEYCLRLMPARQYRLLCVCHVLLLLLSAALLLFSASRPIPANTRFFVTLPQALCLLGLGFSGLGVFRCCVSSDKLEKRQYRESVPLLIRFSAATAAAMGLTAIAYAATANWLYALLCLFAAGAMLTVFLTARRVPYTLPE